MLEVTQLRAVNFKGSRWISSKWEIYTLVAILAVHEREKVIYVERVYCGSPCYESDPFHPAHKIENKILNPWALIYRSKWQREQWHCIGSCRSIYVSFLLLTSNLPSSSLFIAAKLQRFQGKFPRNSVAIRTPLLKLTSGRFLSFPGAFKTLVLSISMSFHKLCSLQRARGRMCAKMMKFVWIDEL